jgi:flagellar protein FliO/FliZ
MPVKSVLFGVLLLWLPASLAVLPDAEGSKHPVRAVSSGDIVSWSVGLIVVLGIFFLCVWGMRKLGGLNINNTEKMRMVGGLSLGLREKVILLQVGKKQLILGVTPGRIETLLVLEGEDRLMREESSTALSEAGFAQKLVHAIKARSDDSRSGQS